MKRTKTLAKGNRKNKDENENKKQKKPIRFQLELKGEIKNI
jgi:hypothetical protein